MSPEAFQHWRFLEKGKNQQRKPPGVTSEIRE